MASPHGTNVSKGKRFDLLYQEQLAIAAEDAWNSGDVGYVSRALVQATLPYKEPKGSPPAWGRTNGRVSLVIQPGYSLQQETVISNGKAKTVIVPKLIGYPYGSIPRLLLAWLGREVKLRREREITLGRSLAAFMAELGMGSATGGKNGSITRLREQMSRTFAAKIAMVDNPEAGSPDWQNDHFVIADKTKIWWDRSEHEPHSLFDSKILLSERFFNDLLNSPVPIDMRALKALKGSPSSLDLYCFLTYRVFSLRRQITIPWEALMMQFGSETACERKFRWQFGQALNSVKVVYPDVRAEIDKSGLIVKPSRTSVAVAAAGRVAA